MTIILYCTVFELCYSGIELSDIDAKRVLSRFYFLDARDYLSRPERVVYVRLE